MNYCGSFPELFRRVDAAIDSGRAEGAETLDMGDVRAIADECWQCKLCYIRRPYTPDEGASEALDFPRILVRERAQRAQREGIPLVDRLLGEPQLIGQLGSGSVAPIANFVTTQRLLRKVQEKTTGISAEFPLPPMADETFLSWFRRHEPSTSAGQAGEIVLFPTCYGDYNVPHVPAAATRVLEHNGYRVFYPEGGEDGPAELLGAVPTCCGLPNLDGGDIEAARRKIAHNVASAAACAGRAQGAGGRASCGMMLKKNGTSTCRCPRCARSPPRRWMCWSFVVLGREKRSTAASRDRWARSPITPPVTCGRRR